MWIPDSTAKTLVDNIINIIKYNPHLITDVRQEYLEELKTQLEKLRRLMPNFVGFNIKRGPVVRKTVSEMREILDGCEDAVDYVYNCCSCRRSMLNQMFLTDSEYQISKAKKLIQEAGDKVKYMNEEIIKNGYDQVLHSRHDEAIMVNLDPAQNFSTADKVREERVFGFDEAAAEVVGLLTTGAEHLEVISIVGMMGIGKTTLARMVYTDHEVQSQYNKIKAFYYIPIDYDLKEMLIRISSSFASSNYHEVTEMDEYRLKKHVRQQLEGKQYLIVLDDIRKSMDWDSLKDAFPDNRDKRCRILITTHFVRVAEHAVNIRNSEFVYRLDFLTLESSQELLRWRVFGDENHCPVELQEYEKDIVRKCDGFPLALMSAAAMLMKHQDEVEWWKMVAYTLSDYIARDVKQAFVPIYLAYMHLPNQLKPCFLYLAAFRSDSAIPVWKLLRLWISEGFILEEGGSLNLEEIAEQYLEELVARNFLIVLRRRSNGRIGSCTMSGMFHEFCTLEASRENLIRKLKYENMNLPHDPILDKCRRIGISAHALEFLSESPTTGKGIRSFLLFSFQFNDVDLKTVSCIPKSFKLLKVLDAASLFSTCLPVQFWNLVLLKYLAISGKIVSLPSTLSELWSLQTLIVDTTSPTLLINADIWKMPHFRHLHTDATASFPCQISSQSQRTEEDDNNLQTLCYISPESCKKEVFHRTTKLKKLGMSGTLIELFEPSLLVNLHKLEYLENLKLLNSNEFPSLAPKISFPKQLTKLTLSNTRLDWKEMCILGELEKLEVLKLKEYAFMGEHWKTENGCFLRLKHLHIGHTDLKVWEALADHFPQLRSLEISECDRLYRVPHGLADISSLQSVVLHRSTSPGVTYSLKRIRLVKFLQAKDADKRRVFRISVYPPED